MSNETPPAKRQRLDDSEASESLQEETKSSLVYHEDGDCALRAGALLFKVHRWTLERESPIFRDMFSVPSNSHAGNVEGSDASNPIVLSGDIPEHVEALLFYLYMGPDVAVRILQAPLASLVPFMNTMDIMHKYQFEALERWANTVLQYQLVNWAYGANNNPVSNPDVLTRVLSIAERSQNPSLRSIVEKTWVSYMWSGSLTHVLPALDAVKMHGSRILEASAYRYVLKTKRHLISPGPSSLALTATQHLRLAVGYLNLTNLWTTLESCPTFDCKSHNGPGFGGDLARATHNCEADWLSKWKVALIDLRETSAELYCSGGDVIGSLVELRRRLVREAPASSSPWSSPSCFQEALSTLDKIIKDLDDNFLDHFVLPIDITPVSISESLST